MTNRHELAIRAAEDLSFEIRRMFDLMGNVEHPDGEILQIYRSLLITLRIAWDHPIDAIVLLRQLSNQIRFASLTMLQTMLEIAIEKAIELAFLLDLPAPSEGVIAGIRHDLPAFALAWISTVVQQTTIVISMIVSGMADPGVVMGDGSRVGLLSPKPTIQQGSRWLASVASTGFFRALESSVHTGKAEKQYLKQAIATLDKRTTNCCIAVHGQIQEMENPFKLTATPRYADEMQLPPFHDYCRTVSTLIHVDDANDELIQEMREAAQLEIRARKTG